MEVAGANTQDPLPLPRPPARRGEAAESLSDKKLPDCLFWSWVAPSRAQGSPLAVLGIVCGGGDRPRLAACETAPDGSLPRGSWGKRFRKTPTQAPPCFLRVRVLGNDTAFKTRFLSEAT